MKSRITSTPLRVTSAPQCQPLLRFRLDHLEEVLLRVIDDHISAQLLARSNLLRSLSRRVHLVSESFRHLRINQHPRANLNCARTDTRGTAVHHERLAGLQLTSHEDIAVGGEEGFANSSSVNHIRVLGHGKGLRSYARRRSPTHIALIGTYSA